MASMRWPAVMVTALSAFVVAAPVTARAATDPAPELVQAVLAARDGGCGPLNYNPTVEHAADIVNRSTFTYLDHSAECAGRRTASDRDPQGPGHRHRESNISSRRGAR